MINVALVGTWHVHFEGYANTIRDNPLCKITAIWDNNKESALRYAKQYNCEYIEDYDFYVQAGKSVGIPFIEAGAFVRSSFRAFKMFNDYRKCKTP